MKVIAIIPARYRSTRFEGKPLADICGKPMIWWVYRQLSLAKGIRMYSHWGYTFPVIGRPRILR